MYILYFCEILMKLYEIILNNTTMKSLYYHKNIIKSIFLLILSFFSAHFAAAQQCTSTTTGSNIRCGTTAPSATAKITTESPTSYEPVQNFSPAPVDMSVIGINAIALLLDQSNIDDTTTPEIGIGFNFVFYGNPYSTAIIQTNGIVGFPPFNNASNTGYYENYIPVPIPNPGVPNNYIAGMFADFDLRRGGTILYATTGTAPNRKFVVEYKNLRPYTGSAPGTASFQIILNENGTFEVIILQLSANFNSNTSGGLMTSGAENIDGTIANAIPGRNNVDWITNGVDITSPNSWIFSAVTCTFIKWTNLNTSLDISTSTIQTITPRPSVTTVYRASWQCGVKICTADATVTVIPPTLINTLITNNTNCTATSNASITFASNLPNGTYNLSYLLDGVPASSSVTVSGAIAGGNNGLLNGTASLTGLDAGTYTNFSLTGFTLAASCSFTLPTTIIITKTLAIPTVTPITGLKCPNTITRLENLEASVAGTTLNWYSLPNGGGTLLGTNVAFIDVSPVKTTKYYLRRESATCGVSADIEITVNVKPFVYALNATNSTTYCTDNAGWNHFFNASDQIVFSVKGNLGAGTPQATISLNTSSYQSPNAVPNCAAPVDENFEMARSWNFSLGAGVPTGSYDVRFYYDPTERTNAETAANDWKVANPSCNYGYKYTNSASPDFATNTGFYWFKNATGNYSPPTYDVLGLHLAGAIKNLTDPTHATDGTANYVELSNITSFSGGSGAVILAPPIVPLPVTLLSFSGKRINSNQIKLTWETVAEINNAGFEVEFATDARNFEKIAFQPAQANNKTVATYQQNINNTIGGYFRLKQIDKDNKYNYSKIIYIDGTNDALIRIYPNPTKDNLTIDLGEFKATDEVKATFRNVLGVQVTELSLTKTQTEISLGNLPKGIYMLQIMRNGKMIVEKVVLQ